MKLTIILCTCIIALTIVSTGAMINRSQLSIFEPAECESPHHELTEI
jgi:hypothetical protein